MASEQRRLSISDSRMMPTAAEFLARAYGHSAVRVESHGRRKWRERSSQ